MSTDKDRRHTQIGIDRLIRLEWLERTVNYALSGKSIQEIKILLQDDLKDSFQSENTTVRGSIDKTITILMKTWLNAPIQLRPLQNDGIKLISSIPFEYHIAVHWGMIMAVYPFWGAVAMNVGRLLKLQGSAGATQVQRRLREQYGERETVSRRVRYALRSYIDWSVLSETGDKGIYAQEFSLRIDEPGIITWLLEAALYSQSNSSANLRSLIENPSLFPFHLKPLSADVLTSYSSRLECMRHGLDEDLVMLRG
ncbi:MAG TPA: hypothetical protein PLK94_01155 [Alphaproteobacteria bacterium]|nr:hypothetical protein [Alphaproteobacteria bacterium]